MKLIVTHNSPDLDAVASCWIIKRFLPGWEEAEIATIPAGERLKTERAEDDVIEHLDGKEVIHVDTGMGPLDHHQTEDNNVCATSKTFDYVYERSQALKDNPHKTDALKRIVNYAIDDDHFQEVFYPDPTADVYQLSIIALISGIKVQFPKDDQTCIRFGFDALDAALHGFENRIWADEEIREKGIQFTTKWGRGLAVETINDEVLKVAQLSGFVIVLRKDPKTGSVRIKARPDRRNGEGEKDKGADVDLTPVYEILKKMDPEASWFLHVSRRMLLNGSSKNPTMRGSKLTLSEVVEVLQNL